MGLLDKLSGNAVEVNAQDVSRELAPLLAGGENVEHAFRVVRDMFVFTNKRLITIDKQGATGKKVDYRSIPYRSVSQISKESAGVLDFDAELKIWLGSNPIPLTFEFNKNAPVNEVYRLLSEHIL